MLAWPIRSTHRFCRLHVLSWNSIYIKAMSTSVNNYQAQWSMARRASGKRWSVETEVRKRKYGSEKKSLLSVFNALLTHKCVCWGLVDKRELNLCDVKAGSSALGLRWASLSQLMCMWQPDPNQDRWANHVGSMLLWSLDSDADASVVVVLLQWLNQLKTTPETLANCHRSLGTSPRQDYTHRVMLKCSLESDVWVLSSHIA